MSNILLMDDDLVDAFDLANQLRVAGHEVQACAGSDEARSELERTAYDILITDIVVRIDGRPVPDGGISLISWVRSPKRNNPRLQRTPIIAISGTTRNRGMKHILATAEQIGANAGLTKPIDLTRLCLLIAQLTAAQVPSPLGPNA